MRKIKPTQLSYIIEVPRLYDEAFLCFMQENDHIPFPMKRIYFISNVENKAIRGKHAHKVTKQILFCIQGKVKIILDNGIAKEEVILNKPNQGLYLDTMMWHEMVDFSKDSILLVLASEVYIESDYIRNYQKFLEFKKNL